MIRVNIDYGGTWVRFSLFQKNKRIRSLKVPSIPLAHLPALIRAILKKWKAANLSRLTIGAKGVWSKQQKESLKKSLQNFAGETVVLSDVELAHHEIFENRAGVLLIAGTGSIAYGKDACGHGARAGGFGPFKGDEGSGYWIGKEFLKQIGNDDYQKMPVRKIASFAKKVIQKAEKKKAVEEKIILEAHRHLSTLAAQTAKKLRMREPVPLALSGGLFESGYFKNGFLKCLRKRYKFSLWKGGRSRVRSF